MANLYDLVVAPNMVAYWQELNKNEQPLLGETLFPKRKQLGLSLSWIKGAKNQPIALRPSAFDAKSIRRDVEGIKDYMTKMPFFKESVYIDEDLRQKLNEYQMINNTSLANQILIKIYDNNVALIDAARITQERMRMEALTTGTITVSGNGVSYTYDFGVPGDQKVDASSDWSTASADVLGDIEDVKDMMKAKGYNITRAICNNSVVRALRNNTQIKNAMYAVAGLANANVMITEEDVLNFLSARTGINFYVYDNVYVDTTGAHKYVPDNTIVFMPEGSLGYTNMGTTPEESDLMASNTANVSIVDTGIAVTTHVEHDPVNVETKVSQIVLPSFERADEIVIFDTTGA